MKELSQEKTANHPMPSCKISVIIPAYNTAPYLRECMDSALSQGLESMEVLVINDGSTDNTQEILEEYAARDSRVTVFSQTNRGLSATRNRGLRHARGEYIYFLDSDDYLLPGALAFLTQAADDNALDVLYFDADAVFESPEMAEQFAYMTKNYHRPKEYGDVVKGYEMFHALCADHAFRTTTCLQILRRAFLEENGIAFCEGIIHEDNLFSLQCILLAGRASHRKKAFFQRRIRQGSIVTSPKEFRHLHGYLTSFRKMLSFLDGLDLPPEIQKDAMNLALTMRNGMMHAYRDMSDSEREKIATLTPLEWELFQILRDGSLLPSTQREMQKTKQAYADLRKDATQKDRARLNTIDALTLKMTETQQKLHEANELHLAEKESAAHREETLKKQIADAQQKLREMNELHLAEKESAAHREETLKQQIAGTKKKLRNANQTIDLIQGSISYKAGRFVTYVPRRMRDVLRCVRANGVAFTGKRILEKMRQLVNRPRGE